MIFLASLVVVAECGRVRGEVEIVRYFESVKAIPTLKRPPPYPPPEYRRREEMSVARVLRVISLPLSGVGGDFHLQGWVAKILA